jgi:putative flippase GtrA
MIKLLLKHSFARYVLVGGVAFVTEYTSFYGLFVGLKIPLLLANALSFCLGLLVAFGLNRLWVFSAHEYDKAAHHQLGLYISLAVINLFLTLALVASFTHLGIKPTFGKLIAMVITSSWNFILLRFLVFTHVV